MILENGIKPPSSATPKPTIEREEPEKIKKWREEQRKRLEEKGKLGSNYSCLLTFICLIFNIELTHFIRCRRRN